MSRLLVALLILTAAVIGLAMTARAQQEPAPLEADAPEQTVSVPSSETSPVPSPEAVPAPCQPDRILVKVKPGADPTTVIERYGGTIIQTISGIDVQIVNVSGGSGQAAIDGLTADPDVQYAEPDGIVRIASEGGC